MTGSAISVLVQFDNKASQAEYHTTHKENRKETQTGTKRSVKHTKPSSSPARADNNTKNNFKPDSGASPRKSERGNSAL